MISNSISIYWRGCLLSFIDFELNLGWYNLYWFNWILDGVLKQGLSFIFLFHSSTLPNDCSFVEGSKKITQFIIPKGVLVRPQSTKVKRMNGFHDFLPLSLHGMKCFNPLVRRYAFFWIVSHLFSIKITIEKIFIKFSWY